MQISALDYLGLENVIESQIVAWENLLKSYQGREKVKHFFALIEYTKQLPNLSRFWWACTNIKTIWFQIKSGKYVWLDLNMCRKLTKIKRLGTDGKEQINKYILNF